MENSVCPKCGEYVNSIEWEPVPNLAGTYTHTNNQGVCDITRYMVEGYIYFKDGNPYFSEKSSWDKP